MERPECSKRAREDAAPSRRWVRELSPQDDPEIGGKGTGELLPDGAVVLREDDIDRMGLRTLRQWLAANSVRPRHPIAFVRRRASHRRGEDDGDGLD